MTRDGELLPRLLPLLLPALELVLAGSPLPARPEPGHRQPGGPVGGDPHRIGGHPRPVAQEAAGAAVRGAVRLPGPERRRAVGEGGRQAVGDREAGRLRAGQEADGSAAVRAHPGQLRGSAAGRVRQTQVSPTEPDLDLI